MAFYIQQATLYAGNDQEIFLEDARVTIPDDVHGSEKATITATVTGSLEPILDAGATDFSTNQLGSLGLVARLFLFVAQSHPPIFFWTLPEVLTEVFGQRRPQIKIRILPLFCRPRAEFCFGWSPPDALFPEILHWERKAIHDPAARMAYSDWLEERGLADRAEMMRAATL